MKAFNFIILLLYYLLKLVQANFIIAFDILTPRMHLHQTVIEIPVQIRSNLGILVFSNLLSMTPGSLTIDVSNDKKLLYAHVLHQQNIPKARNEIMRLQEKIKKVFA